MRAIALALLIASAPLADGAAAKSKRSCGGWIEWRTFPETASAHVSPSGKAGQSTSADIFFFHAKKWDIARCIRIGADPNARIAETKGSEGWQTPLLYAVRHGNLEATKALIDQGADVNAKDGYGVTPLHHAAGENLAGIGKMLVEAGADVNIRDESGHTPLHYATRERSAVIVGVLLELGADMDITNWEGRTAFDAIAGETGGPTYRVFYKSMDASRRKNHRPPQR